VYSEGRRGAASLYTIVGDKPRYTNLLLLLRVGAELTATVLVTAVALSTWGFNVWVGLVVVLVMLLSSYVAIGVLPRTIGRQHPYSVGLVAGGPTNHAGPRLPGGSLLLRHRAAGAGGHGR
jgi:CBS domain containing-hemolysin-like protein